MSSSTEVKNSPEDYVPPKVWKHEAPQDGKINSMNSPTAGARFERKLSTGKHPIQLYSLGTPNGQKVTVMLEELLAAGHDGAEYDAWLINIMELDQFGSEFVDINPNSKIPAMRIYEDNDKTKDPVQLFESGSILLHLAEKFDNAFLPPNKRTEVLNWLFWQMGSAPYLGGGFGHFYNYAPNKQKYPIDRFTMEAKRQLDVLDKQLSKNKYIAGDEYTIADIAIFTWYGRLVLGKIYRGAEVFLNAEKEYPNLMRWTKELSERPAVKRGLVVNVPWGEDPGRMAERHDKSDFEKAVEANKEG